MFSVIRLVSILYYVNGKLTVAVSSTGYRGWEEWTDFQEIPPAVGILNSLLSLNLCLENPAVLIVNIVGWFPAMHFFITFIHINKSPQ
jgi:hypothetical protein